ncbi:MAG: prolyl oligopeptidase family serine peptidase [Candidatus Latescibacterota bacterium]|nr:MAG: prolyl oligopeptidase family serine peptidase [Candidatus Latescibacterota bacterium]
MRVEEFVAPVACVAIVCLCCNLSHAKEAVKPLSVDDVVRLEVASGFDISPDGSWVVWVKSSPDKETDKFKRNLFLSATEDTVTLQITRSTKDDYAPAFSPDGSRIAFLSRRGKAKAQIYLYDIRGAEPEKLTKVTGGIRQFEWRDAKTILFSAREDSTFRERNLKKGKDTTIIVADQQHYSPVRLFEFNIEKKETRRITVNESAVTEFDVSPDGRWAVTNENVDVNYTYDNKVPPRQFLTDLDTGDRREILTAPHVTPYRFRWDGQSKGFYCRRDVASDSTDTYVSIPHLYYFDLDTETLAQVPIGSENGLGRSYVVVGNGIVAALAGGVRDDIVYFETIGSRVKKKHKLATSSGEPMRLAAGQKNGNRLVYFVSDASTIPVVTTGVIRRGKLKEERRLTKLNENLKKKTLAKTEIISWKGALDDEVEGVLYYPLEYKTGERYPVIVVLHGGPSGVDPDFFTERYTNYPHLLASKGAFVLKVNHHGSGNYGLQWVESIKGHYYEYEVPDILTGIEHLSEKGLIDTDKLGIMGWSNGSILAIETCIQDDRFRALCAGAGDVNWTSDYGNCRFGAAFDNAYIGGPPWELPEIYVEKSPLFRMQQLKTPTLIMFGTKDTSVPTEQGWQHFRAMQQIGMAPVRFLLFPGETHGFQKIAHRKRKIEEELAWFDEYLFDDYQRPNEAFDESSLLAVALKRAKAAREGALLGVMFEDILVPEIVEHKEIKVGRFEITRSQFKAFRPEYEVLPGTENHPANDVLFDDARAYCEWLSERTNRRFRLPTTKEMTKFLKSAEPNLSRENNLERWVGFIPTPEEISLLEPKIDELETARLLLEEVGCFSPVGDHAVYDLGGNAAEWAVDGSGEGTVMGLSAVSSRDPRVPYTPPTSAYVGFRIVEE